MTIAEGMALVEDMLADVMSSDVDLLSEASKHLIRSGGKRIRPRVLLLSYMALGALDMSRAVLPAVAIELIHTASLVHDDINDCSALRRGQPTINARWGDDLALLVGDFVFIKLLRVLGDLEPTVVRLLGEACQALVEGETLQMLSLGSGALTEGEYLRIVEKKTGSLFSVSSELGALLAGGTEGQRSALKQYGRDLGIAFQIRDDTLDLVARGDDLGKPVGSDLESGKWSLAALHAASKSGEIEEAVFSSDIARTVWLLKETGAIDYAMQTGREYALRAKDALSALPPSEAKESLQNLADFAVVRGA